MEHNFYKEISLGTLTSKFKEHADGTVSVWTVLNGNDIYRGYFDDLSHAESWFIVNGYDMF